MNKIQELILSYAKTRDGAVLHSIIERLQKEEKLWSAYSLSSRNHYMQFHEGLPTAYLFSDPEYCDAFRKHLLSRKIMIAPLECGAEQRVALFSDLFRSGIEQVIVDNGQNFVVIRLSDIISLPDFSSVPEQSRPLLNPRLMRAACLYYQTAGTEEKAPKIQLNFMKELYQAKFLLPIVFDKEPPKGMELRQLNIGDASFDIAVLKKGEEDCFIPVFTDWVELSKADKDRKCTGNIVSFSDIDTFCSYGELISINPLGFNMVLDKTTVEEIKKLFAAGK